MSNVHKKLEKAKLLEQKLLLKKNLPHLYGYKFYPWARKFFESTNKVNILCSGNQISKSSTQIRKVIHWATSPKLWPILWPHMPHPRLFLYFYPSSYLATIEFENKWIPEFLPRNDLQNHPLYGWHAEYRAKYIQTLKFNSGITVAFKTYSQDVTDLQASTPAAVFIDEEPPEEIVPEIQARLFATNGYIHFAFTPTLGQEFFREAIEETGPKERFKTALKLQVSMYDCLTYEDGTPSFWTKERIEQIKNSCKSDAEIKRRVYGRFVLDSGLKYQAFDPARNVIEPVDIPRDWSVYIGVDSGSGGRFSHPSAVCFVAMRPDYQLGYVFKGRRFDGMQTTNSDLVSLVMDMKRDLKNPVIGVFYDYAATDLRAIAYQMGETWIPAEKSHLIGEQYVNVSLKNKMLQIFDLDENYTLISELKSVKVSTPKNQAHDDHCFVAGTKISTPIGDRPIEELKCGDLVYTRVGAREVTATGNRLAPVEMYEFSDGAKITCTSDHPFWNGSEFKSVSMLTHNDTLYTFKEWQNQNRLNLKASFLEDTRNRSNRLTEIITDRTAAILEWAFNIFIRKYGSITVGRYLAVTQFITKMGIRRTIKYPTLSALMPESTNQSTWSRDLKETQPQYLNTLTKLGRSQKNGMHLRTATSSTESLDFFLGKTEVQKTSGVRFVTLILKHLAQNQILGFARMFAERETSDISVKLVKSLPAGQNRVYNITVDAEHEYFANGILVSNCDALRYAITKIPWDWSKISGQPLPTPAERVKTEIEERRSFFMDETETLNQTVQQEIEAWNELFDYSDG